MEGVTFKVPFQLLLEMEVISCFYLIEVKQNMFEIIECKVWGGKNCINQLVW